MGPIPKIIDGQVKPIQGKRKGGNVVIRNSEYWVALPTDAMYIDFVDGLLRRNRP